ncbi:putative PHD type zinc finger protein with BAH domain-containing protein [Saitozyma podzolica]|uniref:Putative PHD type zinc finger protein with BAH domain-containing protein n=1 Tax=Saitozyma podzolica TaxID=1890683 RepID=A0A427YGN3_9TREE|nr:putative PHD type zinc finger protein with BAH domain-containing protein [Saitozyma podzolica]
MVLQGYKATSAKLANGELVFVNDHVYVSPPWSDRDGTPYWVARIIEFLPPHSTPKKGSRQSSNTAGELQARVSLYYRPSDISGRNVSDFRLLLAAIHTDVQPLSNVRGKCYVRHKDRIDDLIAWKRLPDHFYFIKYFDPYIKREFEVIRTENVNNIPANVKETLMNRYEYLITEREMVADLTDAYRTCCVCDEWASSQDSVRCEACKKHYHMACLKPPLLAKPAKGYSWVCLPCSLQRHKDVEEQRFHYGNGSAAARQPKAAVKKEASRAKDGSRPDVSYRGWPWRYFGSLMARRLYTRAQDTLDPEDLIFPRAATRVGVKYQANVLSWEEQQAAEAYHGAHHGFVEGEAGPSRHIIIERGHDVGERKHESTLDVISTPSTDFDLYMQEVQQLKLPVPSYDVERLNRAATTYTSLNGDRDEAFQVMRHLKLPSFNPIIFTDKETAIFEEELEKQGGLDAHETAKILGKRPAEVLRFSYIWKNRKLRSENEALRAHHKVTSAHARQNKTLGAPSLGRIRGSGSRQDSEASDDEVSLYSSSYASSNKMQCAACSTRISSVWWRCPRTVQGIAMCESCGSNYRKYGVISFVKADDVKRAEKEKKEAAAPRKSRGAEGSGASTPVPQAPPKLPPCACCRRMEPKSMMARCKNCSFSVHAGCYGIASQDMGPEWECELCANIKLEENHLEPRCLLCPIDTSALNPKSRVKRPPADFDILSALKPTEGRRWAHVLCSAWIPEVIYTNPATFKMVEGVTTILRERWESVCSLCNQNDGATISCAECAASFHASCAWQSGYRFGFEFSLAKPGKREVVTITKFKEEAGVMNAGCWCKGHDLEGRQIYDMHEIDPEQNETALQIYTASYKCLPPHDETFALLRKATRLDLFLPQPVPKIEPLKECRDCGVDVSPLWHDLLFADDAMEVDEVPGQSGTGGVLGRKVCHLCWFKYQ